jgi:hypothetical protein
VTRKTGDPGEKGLTSDKGNDSISSVLSGCHRVPYIYNIHIGGRATLKMLRCKSKMQFANQERNTQNAIALLNYLKHVAPQQLMLRTQVFTKKCVKRKDRKRNVLRYDCLTGTPH